MSKRMYHPCHKLSVPSAKLFWCRHCMQMFEDAISRWKHSRICRFNTGVKHKDQDGQVIQMYVKPDTVSYTQNSLPGQTVIHKPQIKQKNAELKCVICNTKFFSLHDMREHVRYPCQKLYNSVEADAAESDSEVPEELVHLKKIRRVKIENTTDSVVNSGTALSVLAEASKHVESLSHRDTFVKQVTQAGVQQIEQCLQTDPGAAELIPVGASYSPIGQVSRTFQYQNSKSFGVVPRRDLEPVSIVIQAEDGEDLPEDALDEDSIEQYLKDAVQSFEIGQILQVQINQRTIRNYVVGPQGRLFPEDQLTQTIPLRLTKVKSLPSASRTSTTPLVSEVPNTSTTTADSSLLLSFLSEYNNSKGVNNSSEVGRVASAQSDIEAGIVAQSVEDLVPTTYQVKREDILSQSVGQEILNSGNSNLVTGTEHSYQLPNGGSSQPGVVIETRQQSDQANQIELDSLRAKENFSEVDIQNFVALVQRSAPEEKTNSVGTSNSLFPVGIVPANTNQDSVLEVAVPVVVENQVDTEVIQAGGTLNNLVYTYAASDNGKIDDISSREHRT